MRESYKFTNEAKAVFNYIKTDLCGRFPLVEIGSKHYVYSVMQNKTCAAYKTLERMLSGDSILAIEEACYNDLMSGVGVAGSTKYDPIYDKCLSDCGSDGKTIDSCSFFLSLISNDKDTAKFMSRFGVTISEMKENMQPTEEPLGKKKPSSSPKKKNSQKPTPLEKKTIKPSVPHGDVTEVEKQLVDITEMASKGKIDEAIGCGGVIEKIFTALMKRDKNNVVLVGEPGSGKTCTVQHIANMINENDVPTYFSDKRLVKIDMTSLLSGTGFRGSFEAKYRGILDAASKSGKYIFFLDDIHLVLGTQNKLSEASLEMMVQDILSDGRIMFITTATFEGYSKYIATNKALHRRLEKITIEQKSGDDLVRILSKISDKYEKFHNVKYKPGTIEKAIDLSDRFLGGSSIYTVSDILDSAAAVELIKHGRDRKLDKMLKEYEEIGSKIDRFSSKSNSYDEFDELCRLQIEKKSDINKYKKERSLTRKPITVTIDDICKVISDKSGVPAGSVGASEKGRLREMDEIIKSKVVGQDDAVGKVCQAVRRQRVGISNPNKPVAFLFVGVSGVGKTYLAKKLAEEVFGSEKSMVRLDMSEYSDKISTNKLIGSSAGYVGYEEGGILTEAIKKNNHCVLLLDEIEKADEAVYNMFLQVFDEGRLTDNKGVTVDFRNVIIIMTSNIGTREASEFKGLVGFGDRGKDMTKEDIVRKAIKKGLPPEFINRIDDIVLFNSLTDENLREIVKLEINKVEKRVNKMGYSFDKSITEGELVDSIYEEAKKESEYGARPVIREIQRQLEDKLTDFLLENDVKKGYSFSYTDIYKEKE